jgi:hypothetical protein
MKLNDDDLPIERVLTGREVVALCGTLGPARLRAGCVAPSGAGSTTAATANPAGSPVVNAEAASAVALRSDPTAVAGQVAAVNQVAAISTAVPGCVVREQVTEGSYYVDVDLVRADIRSDPASVLRRRAHHSA